MKARRVGIFLPSLRGGGAERVAVNLAGEFVRRGLEVDLILAQAEGPYLERLPPEVRVEDLAVRRVMQAIPGLTRYLHRRRPAAVLSTLGNANIALILAGRRLRGTTRLVLREPNTVTRAAAHPRGLRERLLPWFIRRYYPRADAIIANSLGSARDLTQRLAIPEPLVHVISNPLDLAAIRRQAEDEPAIDLGPRDSPLVVAAGRLTHQKGFADLLRAFALLRARRPARLIILGEGEERESLMRLVEHLALASSVSFPGFSVNPWAVMARSSLFVLSSLWEGQPNALMEAVALGVPVVATDCEAGPREVLLDGALGGLVPVGQPERLARAMEESLVQRHDPALLKRRAEEFAVERIGAQYLRVMGVLEGDEERGSPR